MFQNVVDLLILAAISATIYFPFHDKVNSGERPWKQWDAMVGWGMLIVLGFCLGMLIFIYKNLPFFVQSVALSFCAGISMSVWSTPTEGRTLFLPYRLARWLCVLGIIWTIGGILYLY